MNLKDYKCSKTELAALNPQKVSMPTVQDRT